MNATTKTSRIWLILLLCPLVLSAQEYHPFPDSNAIWNYKVVGSLSPPYEWTVIDSLGQPVTIGSYEYIEVYSATYWQNHLEGAIREDTILQKIYFTGFSGGCKNW